MRTLRQYRREIFTVAPDTRVPEIADEMDQHSVGSVVVTDDAGGPLGIVTDRDLLRRVVATGRDPDKTTAADVMTSNVVTVDEGEPLPRVIERMKEHGIRRIPVVESGRAVGLVALEDITLLLSGDLWNLSEAMRVEVRDSRRSAWRRRMNEQREEALEELRCQCVQLGRETRGLLQHELSHLLEGLRKRG
ncbi:MAG: CBS domain-containing protein [Myxococcota bacterium]